MKKIPFNFALFYVSLLSVISTACENQSIEKMNFEEDGLKVVYKGKQSEAVLISFDKFVKHDLDECKLYHSFRSFSKEFVIDGQPSEVFQP